MPRTTQPISSKRWSALTPFLTKRSCEAQKHSHQMALVGSLVDSAVTSAAIDKPVGEKQGPWSTKKLDLARMYAWSATVEKSGWLTQASWTNSQTRVSRETRTLATRSWGRQGFFLQDTMRQIINFPRMMHRLAGISRSLANHAAQQQGTHNQNHTLHTNDSSMVLAGGRRCCCQGGHAVSQILCTCIYAREKLPCGQLMWANRRVPMDSAGSQPSLFIGQNEERRFLAHYIFHRAQHKTT